MNINHKIETMSIHLHEINLSQEMALATPCCQCHLPYRESKVPTCFSLYLIHMHLARGLSPIVV